MDKTKREGEGTALKTYREARYVLVLYALILFMFSIPFFAYLSWYDAQLGSYYRLLGITVFISMLWLVYVAHQRKRTSFYSNGLEVQTSTKRYFSTWENLKAFEIGFERNRGDILIIKTHASVDNLEEHGSQGQKYLPIYIKLPLSAKNQAKALLDTEFGQDLYHFAPHLFGMEDKPKNQLEDKLELDEAEGATATNLEGKNKS